VHLKFEINPYDPAILSQIVQSGSDHNQQMLTDSRRPTLAWLEESSTCSDLPKLEGDRSVRTGAKMLTHRCIDASTLKLTR
jgi:baculoviral IAP repeat-containing protein 6